MNKKERLDKALKYFDFYELAKLTMEDNMKIEVKQIKSEETLVRSGNRFFTQEQLKEIARA